MKDDTSRELKAVVVVHNETSTGVVSRIADLRRAMNRSGHPALLIVDAISSLASIDLRHDEWEIDVTVCGSQKGLMVPPGLGFNAVSEKALAANATVEAAEVVLELGRDAEGEQVGVLPVHAGDESSLRPARSAADARRRRIRERASAPCTAWRRRPAQPSRAWGLDIVPEDPAEYSGSLTAVYTPEGHNADRLRQIILDHFDMSLGTGLGKLAGTRVPHRPSRIVQRSDADGHAQRRRDGARARRRSTQPGRRAGCNGIADGVGAENPRRRQWRGDDASAQFSRRNPSTRSGGPPSSTASFGGPCAAKCASIAAAARCTPPTPRTTARSRSGSSSRETKTMCARRWRCAERSTRRSSRAARAPASPARAATSPSCSTSRNT